MSLQHILLGLLVDQPGSGYDLNKRLQAEGQHFWTTDQSQIYRALYKLQADSLVDFETIIQQDSPNKKVYHITDAGRQQLKQWLNDRFEETQPAHIWLAKLYLGRDLHSNDIQQVLIDRLGTVKMFKKWAKETHKELLAHSNGHQIHKVRQMTLEYKLSILNAEIEWLQTQLDTIGELQTYS